MVPTPIFINNSNKNNQKNKINKIKKKKKEGQVYHIFVLNKLFLLVRQVSYILRAFKKQKY